jgi:hypothetical protein
MLVSRKIKNNNLSAVSAAYSNLLYIPLGINLSLVPNQGTTILESHHIKNINKSYLNLYRALNLKNKPLMRRPFKKNQKNVTPTSTKIGFVDDVNIISKTKKNAWSRCVRLIYKKLNRFAK